MGAHMDIDRLINKMMNTHSGRPLGLLVSGRVGLVSAFLVLVAGLLLVLFLAALAGFLVGGRLFALLSWPTCWLARSCLLLGYINRFNWFVKLGHFREDFKKNLVLCHILISKHTYICWGIDNETVINQSLATLLGFAGKSSGMLKSS